MGKRDKDQETDGQDRDGYETRQNVLVEEAQGFEDVTEEELASEDVVVEDEPESPADTPEVEVAQVPAQLNPPYRAEGCSVLDRDGGRVAIAGYDHNRVLSGPSLAVVIAEGLNRHK